MTKVQIDDFFCNICKRAGMGELDIKTGKYKSMFCNCEESNREEEIGQLIISLFALFGFSTKDAKRILQELVDTNPNLN